LRWQLDAYRNEVELLKKEQSRASRPDDDRPHAQAHTQANSPEAQIQLLQQNMHSMQQVSFVNLSSIHNKANMAYVLQPFRFTLPAGILLVSG